jgi:myosin heavy subunit
MMEFPWWCPQHYAGNVRYDSTGFCEKTRDALSKDLYAVMAESGDALNSALFPPQVNIQNSKTEKSKK